jgi:hypothetical protein
MFKISLKVYNKIQYNDSLNKIDFTFFLKQLKLSNFFISLGRNLYNLIPILTFTARASYRLGRHLTFTGRKLHLL